MQSRDIKLTLLHRKMNDDVLEVTKTTIEFPIGILGQVWCLIVSIPDLCPLPYFVLLNHLITVLASEASLMF